MSALEREAQEFRFPCAFCGTPLNGFGEERSEIAAAGPRISHMSASCLQRVHAALEHAKRTLDELTRERDAAALIVAAQTVQIAELKRDSARLANSNRQLYQQLAEARARVAELESLIADLESQLTAKDAEHRVRMQRVHGIAHKFHVGEAVAHDVRDLVESSKPVANEGIALLSELRELRAQLAAKDGDLARDDQWERIAGEILKRAEAAEAQLAAERAKVDAAVEALGTCVGRRVGQQ